MRTYKIFIGLFVLLLIVYIIAQVNKPAPINWSVTLNKTDKNPYGAYILYNQLKTVFPGATVSSHREPMYNMLYDNEYSNTAYIVVAPGFETDTLDVAAACAFVEAGNYMFISAYELGSKLMDTLGIKLVNPFSFNTNDSAAIRFTNPAIDTTKYYTASKATINEYFDTLRKPDSTTILGVNAKGEPNFIKVTAGDGAFFVHAAPLCFSNYFLLHNNNAGYASTALSYLPKNIKTVIWDEYYKLGRGGPTTPLRFFLTNEFLRWALWLSITGLLLFVLFNMKRRQRIIPIIAPLRNATLDFVKTVASVYFTQKDNKAIAQKKIQYWLEFVRQRFYVPTQYLNDGFVQLLAKKSGINAAYIERIVNYAAIVDSSNVTNKLLIEMNAAIDGFYKQAK